MASEAELLEIGKIGTEIKGLVSEVEGKVKEKANTADVEIQIKGITEKYNALEEKHKKQGEDLSALMVKMNREGLPQPGQEQRQKALESIVYDSLKDAREKGEFAQEKQTGSKRYAIKGGHSALHEKAVGLFTSGNLTDGASGAAYSARSISQTVITSPSPEVHVRNLMSSAVMTENYLEYPQFIGGEGSPGYQVNQGDTKSQIDYDFVMVPVRPRTIAAWARVSRQSLNDISWLANFFSTQMLLDLMAKEDNELLNGTGTNSIKGIIPSATDYTPTNPSYSTLYEYLVDGIAQLRNLNYRANGIVMNPLDYATLLIYKSTTGEFNYPGLVFGGSDRSLIMFNGTPIYQMNQIATGKVSIGDWNRAQLLIREGINFGLFYEDADNVTKNLVTLRIEEEIALAIYHPKAFLDMDITPITTGI